MKLTLKRDGFLAILTGVILIVFYMTSACGQTDDQKEGDMDPFSQDLVFSGNARGDYQGKSVDLKIKGSNGSGEFYSTNKEYYSVDQNLNLIIFDDNQEGIYLKTNLAKIGEGIYQATYKVSGASCPIPEPNLNNETIITLNVTDNKIKSMTIKSSAYEENVLKLPCMDVVKNINL